MKTHFFYFIILLALVVTGYSQNTGPFTWETVDGVEQLRFETKQITGVFVARDTRKLSRGFARHGLRHLVFKPTGKDVHAPESKVGAKRRHQGHLNVYRVYAGSETFGSLRDDLAELEQLPDGARLTWPSTSERPVSVSARWTLTGAAQFDLELIATPERDLENFEILPACYCPVEMKKFVYLAQGDKVKASEVSVPGDPEKVKLYPFFPLNENDRIPQEKSGRIHSRWKWPTFVESRLAALPVLFAADADTEILLMGDPKGVSAVCATPRPDSGKPEEWNSVGQHSALYLSFFCRDVKAGESVTARARLIFRERSGAPELEHAALFRNFLGEE